MQARSARTMVQVGAWWRLALVVVGAFTLVVPPVSVAAQDEAAALTPGEALLEIQLVDGSVLFARVAEAEGETIVLVTLGGARIEVERSQIRGVRSAEGRVVDGEFWRKDPNLSRLFFTATGRTLDKGEAYLGTYLIVLPFFAVGVTDRFTIAAGAPLTLGEVEPFYLAPKLQVFRASKAEISVGTLVFFADDDQVGIVYGVGTFGTDDRAITAGVGFGFAGDEFSSEPVAMIGGETRVSRRIKLITENYFLPGETGVLFSGGIRILGQRFSTDLALGGFLGEDEGFCCFPLINFSYAFGGGAGGGGGAR